MPSVIHLNRLPIVHLMLCIMKTVQRHSKQTMRDGGMKDPLENTGEDRFILNSDEIPSRRCGCSLYSQIVL